jgi:hypothetical protein
MLVIDMKKFMLSFVTLLLLLPIVYSADITSCKSGSVNWLCERGKLCTCSISGTCTNGNILVYGDYVTNVLCLPKISDKTAIIDWSYCNTTSDYVKIRVDCDEGQSSEKMIIVSGVATTATTTRTSTTVQTTISEGVCGADGYCEITSNECVVGYEDCNSYNTECNTGEKCCCPSLTTTIPEEEGGFNYIWIVPVIVVVIAAVLFYFFFLKEREKKTKLAFKRLYEKWIR